MTSRSPIRRTAVGLAAALPLIAGALTAAAPADAAAPAGRHAVPNARPAWAKSSADKGAASASSEVSGRVYLQGKDPSGLAAYARSVSDPHSADYGKYLTAARTEAKYGTTAAQRAQVAKWLADAGLKTTATRHYVAFRGDARAAKAAFGTALHNYRKGAHTYRAPSSSVTVPAAVSGAVLAVSGLDNAPHRVKHQDELPPPPPLSQENGQFSAWFGQKQATVVPEYQGHTVPYIPKPYTGHQLRRAYNTGKLTGRGVRVAVVDAYASPTMAKDAVTYAARNGDRRYRPGQYSEDNAGSYRYTDECGASGWYGEESLDVEAVHAVAPDASIVYNGAGSCDDSDLMAALQKIVDKHSADIVSNSWAGLEADATPALADAYNQIFMKGAVEGIGFNFSTGDDGDYQAASGTKQVAFPVSSPWATAVGGTSLALGRGGRYEWESGWGSSIARPTADGKAWAGDPTTFRSGAGGGTSKLFDQPDYQRGVVPDSLAKAADGTPNRTIPDVAADADPYTGFNVGQTQTAPDGSLVYGEYGIGGTSLACPLTSAMEALAIQARHGKALGFANPALYERAGTGAFHDVSDAAAQGQYNALALFKNGTDDKDGYNAALVAFGRDSSLKATRGYDDVTGLGSPAGAFYRSLKH